jgi:hypothetical protein
VKGAHMATEPTGFTERLVSLYFNYQGRLGRQVTLREIGTEVARAMGRPRPFAPSAVSRWFDGAEPDLATITGIARVFGVDPGWLAFGGDSAAPAPCYWLVRDPTQ